jgi:Tfp pilus assembly protein PilN
MFNLLPENEKKKITKEYAFRRNIVLFMFLFALGSVASVSLFPSYLLSSGKIKETQQEITTIKNSLTLQESGNLSGVLKKTNIKLQTLGFVLSDMNASDLFEKVFDKRDVNIRITSIMYQKPSGKGAGSITFNGVAHDRESLSTFVDNLKKEPSFTQVDLPVANLAKDRNADFTIKIQGKF